MANSPIIYGATGATSLVPGGIALPGATSGSLQILPSAVTTSYALTMPATQSAANQSLVNNGSGVLTWAVVGAQVSDWVAYVPTFVGLGTVTGIQMWSRRIGDSLEVAGTFTTGTATAATVNISLGFNGVNANVSADTTKIPTGAINMVVGVGVWGTANANSLYTLVSNGTPGSLLLGAQGAGQAGSAVVLGTFLGSAVVFSVNARVPISGWTSGLAPNPTIGVGYANTAGTAFSAAVATVVPWPTLEFDTNSIMNSATGVSTIPTNGAGKYSISVVCRVTGTTGAVIYGDLYKNSVKYKSLGVGFAGGGGEAACGGTVIINLAAADTISFVVTNSAGGALETNVGHSYFSMMRIGI